MGLILLYFNTHVTNGNLHKSKCSKGEELHLPLYQHVLPLFWKFEIQWNMTVKDTTNKNTWQSESYGSTEIHNWYLLRLLSLDIFFLLLFPECDICSLTQNIPCSLLQMSINMQFCVLSLVTVALRLVVNKRVSV